MRFKISVSDEVKKDITKIIIKGDYVQEIMHRVYARSMVSLQKDTVLSISRFVYQLNAFTKFIRDGNAILKDGMYVVADGINSPFISKASIHIEVLYKDMVDCINDLDANGVELKEEMKEYVKFD